MKVYKCDSCGRTIESPHEERMKEFYIGGNWDSIFYNDTWGWIWLDPAKVFKYLSEHGCGA